MVVVNKIKEDISSGFLFFCNDKAIDLTHENDALAIDITRIEAWVVDSGGKSNLAKYGVSIFFA